MALTSVKKTTIYFTNVQGVHSHFIAFFLIKNCHKNFCFAKMDFVSPKKRRREKSPTLGEKAKRFYGDMFVKDGKNLYKCKECHREINGGKLYNLANHLDHCHKKLYDEIYTKKKDHLAITRLKLLHNATEIVSKNGRAFNYILDSGYQNGIKSKIQKLNQAGYAISLSHPLTDLKQHLHSMAQKVRQKITESIRGYHVSVLIDITTTNNRSVLGVSVQFRRNGVFTLFSLGIIELHVSHTGRNLATICINRLKEYEVIIRKVISATRDNGANVGKMTRDMHIDLQKSVSDTQTQANSSSRPTNSNAEHEATDDSIAQLLAEAENISDEDALACVIENAMLQDHNRLLNDINIEMQNQGFDVQYDITGVNCAAHTLQLAILDALNAIPARQKNIIELIRRVAKILRLSKSKQQIIEAGITYKRPRLDCVTRWGSMYEMV